VHRPIADRSDERAGRPRAVVTDLRSITGPAAGSKACMAGHLADEANIGPPVNRGRSWFARSPSGHTYPGDG